MTDFSPGALCTFTSPTTTIVLPHCRTASTQSDKIVFYVDVTTLALVIQDFCDMTLVYADGHVGWVYKCWIAEVKDDN